MKWLKISKRVSALTLATVIGLASVAPGANAMGMGTTEYVRSVEMSEMVTLEEDTEVNKTVFLQKLKELFPGRFDFLTEADLHVQRYYYPESPDEETRINVTITKRLKDMFYHGDVTFRGDEYIVENFYLDSLNKEGSYYPGAKSKEEIEKIARDFMAKMPSGSGYVLKQVEAESGWGSNQTLTEPIRYQVIFEKKHNGIPILGQERYLNILGNGDIVHYYGPYIGEFVKEQPTFEQRMDLISEQDARETFLSAIDLELQYQMYSTFGEMKPALIYTPSPSIQGIHASDGTFFDGESFVKSVESRKGLRLLVDKPLAFEKKAITEKEARQIVEQLLPNEIDGWKLNVGGVHLDKWSKQEVYQVSYSYERPNQGHGGSISISKATGEIIHFYSILPFPTGDKSEQTLTKDEAQAKAVEAIKTYLPSQAHLISYPIENIPMYDLYYGDGRNVYSFIFPMVKNGIIVRDGNINVEISGDDGSLISLYRPILDDGLAWPNQQNAVAKEKAREDLEENLKMKLVYSKLPRQDSNHYHLMYQPIIGDENGFLYYDAITGKWSSVKDSKEEVTFPEVEGHWAEEEIRYLINAKILSSIEGLSANKEITKATALEVVLKSIESLPDYMWDQYGDERKPTFAHIDKNHPLFVVVERAVERGIISADELLDLNEPITREELAAWYIRGLDLEKVAKHEQIFTLPFKDSDKVAKDMVGYVALASAYEIFNGDKDGQFQPQRQVTLAELAVSSFKYGKKASELNINRYY